MNTNTPTIIKNDMPLIEALQRIGSCYQFEGETYYDLPFFFQGLIGGALLIIHDLPEKVKHEIPSKDNWISSDAPPEHDEDILLITEHGNKLIGNYDEGAKLYWTNGKPGKITHWQPLPSSPPLNK